MFIAFLRCVYSLHVDVRGFKPNEMHGVPRQGSCGLNRHSNSEVLQSRLCSSCHAEHRMCIEGFSLQAELTQSYSECFVVKSWGISICCMNAQGSVSRDQKDLILLISRDRFIHEVNSHVVVAVHIPAVRRLQYVWTRVIDSSSINSIRFWPWIWD